MLASHRPCSQPCFPSIPLNGMPVLPSLSALPVPAPPISLHLFRSQQPSVTCMAAQPPKSNFETRWAARQRDWRTQLAQLQHRIWCVQTLHSMQKTHVSCRNSQAAQQLLVVLQPVIRLCQAMLALWQQEQERYVWLCMVT